MDLIPSLSYPLDTSSARGHVALEGERGCDLTALDLGGSVTSPFRVRVGNSRRLRRALGRSVDGEDGALEVGAEVEKRPPLPLQRSRSVDWCRGQGRGGRCRDQSRHILP